MELKIMTFNLRIPSKRDGNNHFDLRKEKILEMLRKETPDIIGFQEANSRMLDWLKENLTAYYIVGCGRDEDYSGEGVPIAFRKDLFHLYSFRQEWLSLTPDKTASRIDGLDQSPFPRIFTVAELICKENGRPIAVYNIHTDHTGEIARIAECTILMRAVADARFGAVITGDFNARPESPEITMIKSTEGIAEATEPIEASFHGYAGPCTRKIDYIFTSLPTDPTRSYAVADDDSCGCYYSDHNALCAFVEL